MSNEVKELVDENIVEVGLSGKLTHEDYEAFVPVLEQRIKQVGKIRLLVVMPDFHGWSTAALWDDLKFDFKHYSDIERLALVGDARWESGMALFCKPFTSATVKYFEISELEVARQWIAQ
ncbi:MAG: STAS/SEC14 domain-containing protein [Pirellulaceae bacterium]